MRRFCTLTSETAVVPVLNIIGPVGIGKTSAAFAISDLLQAASVSHAVADLDYLRRAFPAPPDDPFHMRLGFRNLAAVWDNYRESGAQCLMVPSVMESPEDIEALRTAVPGAEIFVTRLSAPMSVTHQRIRGRENRVESLEWYLARAVQLEAELTEKGLEHIVVETGGLDIPGVARRLLAEWRIHSRAFAGLLEAAATGSNRTLSS